MIFLIFSYTYRNCRVKESIYKIDHYARVVVIVCGRKLMLTINQYLVRTATFFSVTGGNWSDWRLLFCPDMGKCWPGGWGVARPLDIPGPDNRSVLLAVMLVPGPRSQAPKAVCGWNTRRVMLDQRGPDLSKLEKRWLDLHVTLSR